MKRASMRLLVSGSALVVVCALASAQAPKATIKKVAEHRRSEKTLAGLRPGNSQASAAIHKFKLPLVGKPEDSFLSWEDVCRAESLFLDVDLAGTIQAIRIGSHPQWVIADCRRMPRTKWRTGHGLAVYDDYSRVVEFYGAPDSSSPSTRDGQQLELLHYSFAWAGPDVPQVMEVICTLEKDGKPGRVVEIKLAASGQ